MRNDWRMGEMSFRLMKEFSDTAYLDVFEKYYPSHYYYTICRERSVDKANSFISTVAAYKNVRSSKILDAILNKNPPANCAVATALSFIAVRSGGSYRTSQVPKKWIAAIMIISIIKPAIIILLKFKNIIFACLSDLFLSTLPITNFFWLRIC